MKYQPKTKLWPHQLKGLKWVLREMNATGSAGLQVPMRFGKSLMAICAAECLYHKRGISKVLFVTTTSGLGVIEKEIRKHSSLPVKVIDYKGDSVQEDRDYVLTYFVIHHAILYGRDFSWGESSREWKPGPNSMIEEFDADFIVMDESHRIGDASSMQSRMAYRYGRSAPFRMTMTGTMFHRAPLMVFGQMKFLAPEVFGTTVTPFKRMYVRYGGYGNYELIGYQNLRDLSTKIKRKVFVQDYVANTPPVVTTTPVRMEECTDVYTTMERESVVTVDGVDISAPIILTKHLRCSQIAGGWLKSEDGRYLRVGSEKARALTDKLTVMQEEGIGKVVIGAMFIPELPDIARAAKKAGYAFVALHGGVPRGSPRDARIAAFQEAERPTVFIAQIQAAAEAIDLSAAGAMIFYSLPQSYLLYSQFMARIEKYKETRTLLYDHLIMKGSRDEITWIAMRLKTDVATFLLRKPELVEAITRRDDIFDRPAVPFTNPHTQAI